ncbi:MAG TPA: S8 family serine peptidase, partial [Thermoanaerobaculia bacterium]|nr:S8 family serine peptidase [Thermoanaerobaculia bacterium]
MRISIPAVLLSLSLAATLAAQPVDHARTRCTMTPAPLTPTVNDWLIERCAADVQDNVIWQLDRSDSVDGDLNGQAARRTTGRGSVVYVIDTGILERHTEFQRDGGDIVLGGFDAHEASGGNSPCFNLALEPCYAGPGSRLRHGHGTAVASTVAGRTVGIAPDTQLYAATVYPTQPGVREMTMWHTVLDHIAGHAWDPATPAFETAVITISVPATPLPDDPMYLALVEKVRRMTVGVDAAGNEDPNGKKFLFTVAAGNLNPRLDLCHTFPAILGKQLDGVVAVGGINRDNVWWSGSGTNVDVVEIVAPAQAPLLAS